MPRAAHAAAARLDVALLTAAAAGQRPPCAEHPRDGGPWLSEHPTDRGRAARACTRCPVTAECLDAAQAARARFGVWGGRDFTTNTRLEAKSDF